MTKIQFDFVVRPITILLDRQCLNNKAPDARMLRRLAKGKIFITFESPRDFIVIESEVLDYLRQINGVIEHIDCGTHKLVTVSGDYFSNNLRFTYLPQSGDLEIYEVNGAAFKIVRPYKVFRTSFLKFYPQAIADLTVMYPELLEIEEFRRIHPDE